MLGKSSKSAKNSAKKVFYYIIHISILHNNNIQCSDNR